MYKDYHFRNSMQRVYKFPEEREFVEMHTKALSNISARYHVIFQSDLTVKVVVRCRWKSPVYKKCEQFSYIWIEED